MAKILPNKFVDDLIDRQAIGVSIPFSKSSVFNQTFTTADQIKSNLINYFLTNKIILIFILELKSLFLGR